MGPVATAALVMLARQARARQQLEFVASVAAAVGGSKDYLLNLAETAYSDDEKALATAMEAILQAGEP